MSHADDHRTMTFVLVIVVWALLLGFSPGLVLIVLAVALFAVDRHDPRILDRVLAIRQTR
jgi:hypothetical protein